MKAPLRPIKVGETFYEFGEKLHYVGVCETGDEPIHIFWVYNKYKQRRAYRAVPHWALELEWEYMKKRKH